MSLYLLIPSINIHQNIPLHELIHLLLDITFVFTGNQAPELHERLPGAWFAFTSDASPIFSITCLQQAPRHVQPCDTENDNSALQCQ